MLSSAEYQFVHDLLINYYNNGYGNFVCITNNPIDYDSNNVYDVFCYISKYEISEDNLNFSISSGKKLSIDSNTQSTNNTIDKLVVENITDTTILVDKKEFIYSNIVGYPDIIGEYRTSINNHLDINFIYTIPCLIILLFIYKFLNSVFKSWR